MELLAAAAPDPGEPSFVPIIGAISFVLGWNLGLLLGRPRKACRRMAEDWAAAGATWAVLAYLFGLVTDLY